MIGRRLPALAALVLASGALAGCEQPAFAEEAVTVPAARLQASEPAGANAGLQTAIFAGGCFWGVEAVFSHVDGVTSAVSGYHGGSASQADYRAVSGGKTDHAEAVRITYDPSVVRYDQLLRIFFAVVVDPTQLNRQGPDIGRHYRSALVPVNAEQKRVAAAYLDQLGNAALWTGRIVTGIEPANKFFPAETYHQDFAAKNPRHPYIVRWDAPKVKALRAIFPEHYRASFRTG